MTSAKTIKVVEEALASSQERGFTESIELAINLKDVDLSIPKNRVDEEIRLPKGRGRAVKIAVIGNSELVQKAKGTADLVVPAEELDDIAEDKKRAKQLARQHDFFIADAPLMPHIGKQLGRVLGPRGKMPKPVPPGSDPSSILSDLRNTIRARSRDKRTFHMPVGTKDMPPSDIAENIDAVLKRVIAHLDRGRLNIASAYVKTTMGPAVRLM